MNDPTTIPSSGATVYGPSTTSVETNNLRGGDRISDPWIFDSGGSDIKNKNNLRGTSDHQYCSDEQAGISGNVYTADADVQYASNFRPTWSRIGLNPSFSRLKRTKRVNKHKKNMVYCM